MNAIQICTKRLVLREYCTNDLAHVHTFASDPLVCSSVEWGPNTMAESMEFLDGCVAELRKGTAGNLDTGHRPGCGVVIGSLPC